MWETNICVTQDYGKQISMMHKMCGTYRYATQYLGKESLGHTASGKVIAVLHTRCGKQVATLHEMRETIRYAIRHLRNK